MDEWNAQKAQFMQQKEGLDRMATDSSVDSIFNTMNSTIKRSIESAGTSGSREREIANENMRELSTLQKRYIDFNKRLTLAVNGITGSADIQNRLRQVGQLKQDIVNLEKDLEQAKQDASTSRSRQGSVERHRQDISFYQGFGGGIGFLKPLKPTTVPILIGTGVLFLILSVLMLREFTKGDTETATEISGLFGTLSSSRAIAFGGGFVFTLVLVGTIAWFGYFGSKAVA